LPNEISIKVIELDMLNLIDQFMCVIIIYQFLSSLGVRGKKFSLCSDHLILNRMSRFLKDVVQDVVPLQRHLIDQGSLYL